MRCYFTPMNEEKNQLLEYTIDTLLNTFNPDRKPIMKKAHFFKMMDIVDTKLLKQGIDIRYPSYWYRYGNDCLSIKSSLIYSSTQHITTPYF